MFDKYVPEYMHSAFAANGVPVNDLLFAIHTDMTPDGNFSDTYVAVDRENLHILYGEERVVKVNDARRLVAEYITHEAVTYRLADIGELNTEALLSTCRMVAKNGDGEERLILLFTLGHQSFADRLIRVVKNIRKGEPPLNEIRLEDALFCPECGSRFPEPERALCPKCTNQVSIFFRLLGFFKYYKGKVAACTAVMFCITAMQILAPDVGTRLFIDEVLTYDGRFYR
ncbi:MAG: hypothetical protein LBI27_06665, partial [Clostridiales bacterium]|nr:hypothetical protein [Clostridiales bacterium]